MKAAMIWVATAQFGLRFSQVEAEDIK